LHKNYEVKAYGKLVKLTKKTNKKANSLSGFCFLFGQQVNGHENLPNKEFKALELIYLLALRFSYETIAKRRLFMLDLALKIAKFK